MAAPAAAPAVPAPDAGPRLPLAGSWALAVRALRFWLVNYRRTWRGSIYSSVLNPVLYLGAMGLGLGTLVDQHGTGRLGGVSYLAFLAPGPAGRDRHADRHGRVAPTRCWPAVKWLKTYQAAVATPLRPATCSAATCCSPPCGCLMNCGDLPGRDGRVRGGPVGLGRRGAAGLRC